MLKSRTFWIGLGQMIAGLGAAGSGNVEMGLAQTAAGTGLLTARRAIARKDGRHVGGAVLTLLLGTLSLLLFTGCVAAAKAIGIPEEAIPQVIGVVKESVEIAATFLPGPWGMIVQGIGHAVSVLGAGGAQLAQVRAKV